MTSVKTGVSAAASAALIAIAAINAAPAMAEEHSKDAKVHCYGVNSCKGTSDCKTAEHGCKGHGYKDMTAQACTAAGGSTTETKK